MLKMHKKVLADVIIILSTLHIYLSIQELKRKNEELAKKLEKMQKKFGSIEGVSTYSIFMDRVPLAENLVLLGKYQTFLSQPF